MFRSLEAVRMGKEDNILCIGAGDRYNSQKQFNYITTLFFDKTAS